VIAQKTDLSLRILGLEQKLESYQKLHAEELDEIRKALAELRRQVLHMATVEHQDTSHPLPSRQSGERSS
jgi:imidazolonepropionase-like amidohydrolase